MDSHQLLYLLMSDLLHKFIACKAHWNMYGESVLFKFVTITTIPLCWLHEKLKP